LSEKCAGFVWCHRGFFRRLGGFSHARYGLYFSSNLNHKCICGSGLGFGSVGSRKGFIWVGSGRGAVTDGVTNVCCHV
jgi:hypothetical protein